MPRRKGTNTMVLVSMHIQKQALEEIDELVKQGVFPSRSEAIRYAIRKLLAKEGVTKAINDYPDEVFMMGR
jgi:Arc/MetJ-type ribon-helix-helix transcriptional regulator